jgi:hypothetical protein
MKGVKESLAGRVEILGTKLHWLCQFWTAQNIYLYCD